jgi:hypothetical protein
MKKRVFPKKSELRSEMELDVAAKLRKKTKNRNEKTGNFAIKQPISQRNRNFAKKNPMEVIRYIKTGLYLQSPAYIYTFLMEEIRGQHKND